ncbi:hypothetical protein OC835_002933 [Tilletia horrida]|nr:hypothetical protein OC835_002933 [Tilletia horrida]
MARAQGSLAAPDPSNAASTKKLTWDDGVAAADTVVSLFSELSDLVPLAGPFLAMGLGVIKEIFAIVQDVRNNKSACEAFATKVMETFHEFAIAAKSAGRPILPGSSAAVLLEPFVSRLKAFLTEIQNYAGLSLWRRTLKRDEIKETLASHNHELEFSILKLTSQATLVQLIRSDYESDMSASTSPSQPSSGRRNKIDLPSTLQALNVADPEVAPVPGQSSSATPILDIKDQLHSVSIALRTEIKRRNTVDEGKAGANAEGQQPSNASEASPAGHLFTSDEMLQLRRLQDQMKHMFLRGDGEDLEGIFVEDDSAFITTGTGDADPIQSALAHLDDLCSDTVSTTSSKTLRKMLDLSKDFRNIGLLDESLAVAQLLTALCRRNVVQKGYAVDKSNLGAALMALSLCLRLVGRHDEALASSEEAADMFKQMAAREPGKYNSVLARSLGILATNQDVQGEFSESLGNAQECLGIYRKLHQLKPTGFALDLARALSNISVYLANVERHEVMRR